MANIDAPRGFQPVRDASGRPTGHVNVYHVPASDGTAMFIGDPVKLTGTSDALGIPEVTVASAGDAICGVMVGAQHFEAGQKSGPAHREASTDRHVLIADDPNQAFEVQADDIFPLASVGFNADLVANAGDTTYGVSGAELDVATAAVTATLVFKVMRFKQSDDNDRATTNAKLIVKANVHQFAANTAGV